MVSASSAVAELERDKRVPIARNVIEFLVAGGGTLALIPLAWWFRSVSGLDESVYLVSMLAFYAAHVINDPHFGVTYLLFYKNVRERALGSTFSGFQRVRYLTAGFVVPVLMLGWIVWAMRGGSAERMGYLIQLMFFLVSWHYVKQGFGVLTVLSMRRGVRFSPTERRWILAHCFSAWAHAWVSPAGPAYQVEESGILYWTLEVPLLVERLTEAAFFGSGAVLLVVLVQKWRRERILPPLAPLVGFFVTVWLWSVYSSFDPLIAYFIPALHSIQYLYFVWLLRRNQARAEAGEADFGRIPRQLLVLAASSLAIGWLLFRGGPEFFDAHFVTSGSGLPLGATPYLAAIGTFVNIHHYFMDNVIWRRDNPESSYLMHP